MDAVASALIERWGLIGLIAVITIIMSIYLIKLAKDVDGIGKRLNDSREICAVREGRFERSVERVEELEKQDLVSVGEFKILRVELKNIREHVNSIEGDIKQILTHFTQKGMS